ncbi:reverse transcriptase domain-containing protein [Tanacetum coccineum]
MDDEPMWAVDRVVASTPASAITIPETANEFAIKGNIIKIFYHDLNKTTQEALNAATDGIFLYKIPNQAYQLLEDKVLLKLDRAKNQKSKPSLKKTIAFTDEGNSNSNTDKIMARMDVMAMKMDAQYKDFQTRSKQPIPDPNHDDTPMTRGEEAKFMQTFRRTCFYDQYHDHDSNRDNWRSSGRNNYNRDKYRSNSEDKPYDLQRQLSDLMKAQQKTNDFVKEMFMELKTQLETTTKNHQASIQNLEAKFDKLADKQSARASGSLPSNTQPNPQLSIVRMKRKNLRHNLNLKLSNQLYHILNAPGKKKMEAQYGKFLDMIQAVRIKFHLNLETLENFNKAFSCYALADLGASINLMPYFLYAKLSLETLKPTKMSVRLVDRSFQYPIGIAKNMLVEVGKFTFPVDFVILKIEEDSKAPLILGRPFLHTADAKKISMLFSMKEVKSSIPSKVTILEEKIFAEFDEFMAMTADENSESEEEEPKFEKITFNTDYKIKTSFEEPPKDLELKPLPDKLEYVFLEESLSFR